MQGRASDRVHQVSGQGDEKTGDVHLAALCPRHFRTVGIQDDDGIGNVSETKRLPHRIDCQKVSPFAASLGPAVEEHVTVLVPGLSGESDNDLTWPRRVAHQPGQDVRG